LIAQIALSSFAVLVFTAFILYILQRDFRFFSGMSLLIIGWAESFFLVALIVASMQYSENTPFDVFK